MILYEYPLQERIRTYLRLEHLFMHLQQLLPRVDAMDHHFALATLFEILEVSTRADLKTDLLKDLDKQKHALDSYRGNPAIAEAVLDEVIGHLDQCFEALNSLPGKIGQTLTESDWLMAIRSRIVIPGGTCGFDLPAYHAWQHKPPAVRQAQLLKWAETLKPMADAVALLLKLLRDSGAPQKVIVNNGQLQQSLPQGRTFLLLRLALDEALELVPEISGNRLMVSVRLLHQGEDNRLQAINEDVSLELALCA
ncbi:cell division protein ZapD [Rhodoferax sp.]|uniref:cell division protein ZapD n=2 Tax=Rhodoferax sp. TaxID=50421 RepID=UPI00272FCC95|nr:cell division protein ZapD [Rhodoferax sp.]MDP2442771.1 cell division protein ZapD [Rhodoferax sp.]MDP3192430.1 cell division protein ZapD [Rhodoferax sp.]MDP3865961.1 cell division protein ZapD [Rhodoferax sp.]MDZ4206417.1 cell division protein ZapD [Rhodoferax sp.]